MKTLTKLSLLLLPLALLSYFFFRPAETSIRPIETETLEVEDKKTPNDWFYNQRAYPTGQIDQQAYFQAAREVQVLKQQQSISRSVAENWEFKGPTNIGGRITDIEMPPSDMTTIYAGTASGGIFKSTDSGTSWNPIFDNSLSLAVGDMAIAQSDESIIYVGTGEANAGGGSLAYDGAGIYKSEDNGDTWNQLSLQNIGSVGRVMIHPTDPQTCYVAAMGNLFGNDNNRGVYKTTDGGANWDQVFFLNDSTGVIDLAIRPDNPEVIYAASWERIRRPNRRSYGGASSGIHRSIDGGATWEELGGGLPTAPDQKGRIGIATAESAPNVLYAMYADQEGNLQGIYKSEDGGTNWNSLSINGINNVSYMWWFGKVFVNPADEDEVFVTSLNMFKSSNGGNSWSLVFNSAHVDQHALFIHPLNTDLVVAGNDGGVYISENGGFNHTKKDGLPITQFYTCEIDRSMPERLYGGTQDNSSMRTLQGDADDWEIIYVGDGFYTLVDPDDNSFVYTEYQYGNFARSTNGGNNFFAATNGINASDRKNWNTPVVFNPNDPSILYYGANRLYRSTNRAQNWTAISPDLSNGPGQNLVYGTITTISVSPVDDNIIVVGTDDGNIQITQDGGTSWNMVSTNLPQRWVTNVSTHPENSNELYATFSGYRFNSNSGNIFKSTDLGVSWMDISGDLPAVPINDLIVRPIDNTLYLATDVGVFYSIDDGTQWELFGENLPNVVINDLCYYEEGQMLVAATFGRGIYTVDLEEPVATTSPLQAKNGDLNSFPNPFDQQIDVSFSLLEKGKYTIDLWSIDGKKVQTLFQGELSTGAQTYAFTTRMIPAGTYLLRVQNQEGNIQYTQQIVKQ